MMIPEEVIKISNFKEEATIADKSLSDTLDIITSLQNYKIDVIEYKSLAKDCGLDYIAPYEDFVNKSLYRESLERCNLPSLRIHHHILEKPFTNPPFEGTKTSVTHYSFNVMKVFFISTNPIRHASFNIRIPIHW